MEDADSGALYLIPFCAINIYGILVTVDVLIQAPFIACI